MRVVAKRLFEEAITRSGLDRISRALRNAKGAVLVYHNVVPTGERVRGEAALHIPQERFAAHLDAIQRTHEVVPLRRLLAGDVSSGRPKVAITFDDAYQGTITAGLHETSRRGLPTTVFVAPGLLGRREFWWDRLADGPGTIDVKLREIALSEASGDQDTILARWSSSSGVTAGGENPMPMSFRPCTVDELRSVLDDDSVTVGSHTWTHRSLPACGTATIEEELDRPVRWLRSRFGDNYLPCVSYPYGRFSEEVLEIARTHYRWGLQLAGGLVAMTASDYAVPRINVPRGMSDRGLQVRLSGLSLR